jgi:hypothetical protein
VYFLCFPHIIFLPWPCLVFYNYFPLCCLFSTSPGVLCLCSPYPLHCTFFLQHTTTSTLHTFCEFFFCYVVFHFDVCLLYVLCFCKLSCPLLLNCPSHIESPSSLTSKVCILALLCAFVCVCVCVFLVLVNLFIKG